MSRTRTYVYLARRVACMFMDALFIDLFFTDGARRRIDHMHHTTVLCCRGDVVQHRPGEQEGDGDGPRVAGGRPREHLQGEEGRTPPRLMDRSTIMDLQPCPPTS